MLLRWELQRDTDNCKMLGPGPCVPSPAQQYSVLPREGECLWIERQSDSHCGHSNPHDKYWSWLRESTRASISCPHTQEEILEADVNSFRTGVLVLAEKGLILLTMGGWLPFQLPTLCRLAGGAGRGRAMVGAADPNWPMACSFHTM